MPSDGFGDNFEPEQVRVEQEQRQPQPPQKKLLGGYLVPAIGAGGLLIIGVSWLISSMLSSSPQQHLLPAYQPPVQQTQPTASPGFPQQAFPGSMASPTAPAPVQQDHIVDALNALRSDIIAQRWRESCTADAENDSSKEDTAALTAMVQDMTNELKTLTESKKQMLEALRASERKIDELTQHNAKLLNAGTPKASPLNGGVPRPKAAPAASGLKGWKVIGLSANRVVITDAKGKLHNLGAGDTINGIKIQSVDLESGNIKTSAGTLAYGE